MAIWSRLTGGIAAFGIGAAAADAIEPELETTKQQAWGERAVKVLPPPTAASADVRDFGNPDEFHSLDADGQRIASSSWGASQVDFEGDSKRQGVGQARHGILRRLAQTVPPYAEALKLWRRGRIDEATVDTILRREAIPEGLRPALKELVDERLDPAVIAVAIQRTVMANPDILPNQPSTAGSNVPPMPQVDVAPLKEARASGISKERLAALTRIVGLPASADLAARMHFRKIITEGAYNQAILEGNTRGEWAPFLLEGFRQILTANQYAELELRGFLTRKERLAETAKHGMSDADSDHLYDVLGRSIPVHQILTGEARGGSYDGPIDGIPAPFLASMRRGNLRPEYYNLAYANRYSYPSAFVLRALTEAGDLTQAESHQVLLDIGWKPSLAEKVSTRWAGGVGAAADPNVKKAQTQLWTTTHRSFVASEITEADVTAVFDQLAIPVAARPEIIGLWMAERDMTRKQLTPTQLKKAFSEALTDPATGQPWTRFDVLNRLTALGYSFEDAETFLDL